MANEYIEFLAERGLSEDDVFPVLANRADLVQKPKFWEGVANLFLSLPNASAKEREQAIRFLDGTLPGRNANWLIRQLNSTLRESFLKAGVPMPDSVLEVGVFPLGSFNARAVPRTNGTIILVDTGCMEVLEFCCALSACFSKDRVPQLGKEFAQGLAKYKIAGDYPDLWNKVPRSDWGKHGQLATYTTNWAEWFVLAHEYGHHALGHLQNAGHVSHASRFGSVDLQEYPHLCEYEADIWALWALLEVAKSTAPDDEFPKAFACSAPFFFLSSLAILEELWRRDGDMPSSHPPAVHRMLILEACLSGWGLLDENCFLWANFNMLFEAASEALFGRKLIPDRPDMELLHKLSLLSKQLRAGPGMKQRAT